jgi:putative endonuclease
MTIYNRAAWRGAVMGGARRRGRKGQAERADRSGNDPRQAETWSLYVVECSDATLYVGIAKDVDARVKAHNAGRGARYTKTRRPVRLLYAETVGDIGTALRRERRVKRWPRAAKVARLGLNCAPALASAPSDLRESA